METMTDYNPCIFKGVKANWKVKTELNDNVAVASDNNKVYLFISIEESEHGAYISMPSAAAKRLASQIQLQAEQLDF